MTLITTVSRRAYTGIVRDKTEEVIKTSAPITPARVTARLTDGLSTLVALDGTCPQRSTGVQSEAIGEVVFTPSSNFQQTGSTGAGDSIFAGGAAWLIRQDPQVMEKGKTTPVTYFGGGFSEFFTIVYLLPRRYWVDAFSADVHPGGRYLISS